MLHRVKETAGILSVTQATVYAMVAAGKLKCYRVGVGRGTIRISDDHIATFLSGAEPKSAPTPLRQPRVKHFRLS
jgi:excisionase family DNA binding protein